MSRARTQSWILGLCALSMAAVSLADLPSPAPQRAAGRKAPPATLPQPHPITGTPLAHATASPTAKAANSRSIVFVGGKSSINSQPVPPGSSGINSQPVPPGKLKPVGPGPGDPALHKLQRTSTP